ncbi:MAG: RlmE family RNA methyltransferase [Deltaproteobacteria bacterium]|jgi:23S rRNA (uridine2552-2'-O)-methyltransferase|nr:RlmE family RNA methyltransferase [Deltaproteobacteria bacterium]
MAYDRKDHFHQRAKREGYRSRAAYKLLEIQRGQRLLKPGQRVIDLGCWPGGWLQVAAAAVGRTGRVVGVDLAAIDPPLNNENVIAFCADFTQPIVVEELIERLGGPADVLLSDAAPKLSGIRAADQAREGALLEGVEALLAGLLRPGGTLLVKILEGPDAALVDRRLRREFESAKTVKPGATRRGSSERYLLGRGYKGPSGQPDAPSR